MILADCYQALSDTKVKLMTKDDSAFFVNVCFSMKHVFDDRISTAATNGTLIKYNPAFFMGLSPEERLFLVLHETMHVAYMHMLRLQDRNHRKFNIAADHVINLQLIERGYKMPKGGLADRQYTGLNVEQVYALIPDNTEEACDMDIEPGEGDAVEMEKEITDILVRAEIQSKLAEDKAGTIPGEIQIFLNKLLNPKLPWHRILQKYLQNYTKDDYSFKKPNRRFFPKYIMPSLFSRKLISIAVAVDTSGSISDHEFLRFISETNSILRMMQPECINFIQFDSKIKAVNKIKSVRELMNVKFTGRGGTLIDPVLHWANENKPQLLLVFSDGYFRFYDTTTKVDTIWLIHSRKNFTASFGKVINYEV